jgi:hypothetical protein
MRYNTFENAWFYMDNWLEKNNLNNWDDENRYEMIEALIAEYWGIN